MANISTHCIQWTYSSVLSLTLNEVVISYKSFVSENEGIAGNYAMCETTNPPIQFL